uniref:SAM domain-containing protein n=1 Tax=Physcomitrium patens TaxID=3218 RepID=A0A7I4CX35_PHYPA
MSGVIDPLQTPCVEEQGKSQEDSWESEKTRSHSPPLLPDQTTVVLQWSVEQVNNWLLHSVPAEPDRLKDISSKFISEGVDGLTLLTLQRSHQACASMTDQEWLLLKVARRWLMTQGERPLVSWPSRVKVRSTESCATPPDTPQSARSDKSVNLKEYHDTSVSPLKQWKLPRLQWGKDDQEEALGREVQHLRGEIVGAEERENLHLAQLDHVDEVLRTSQLSCYLHTRTRWTALSGEPPVDDTDVDDWLLRFVVIRGSSICFFLRATDRLLDVSYKWGI